MTPTIRLAQSLFVAYIGVFGLLTAFGNITDYGSNFAFVQHVMSMDTIFPESHLRYRAITSPALHHAAYWLITQDSPHISNRSKYVCEERLLVQHLRETLHQRAQPLFAHGWD
jgi:hypothetical protein